MAGSYKNTYKNDRKENITYVGMTKSKMEDKLKEPICDLKKNN